MTDREFLIRTLIYAIVRQSVMKADFAGLDLTEMELKRIYEAIGIHFVANSISKSYNLTLEDMVNKYYD